MEQSGARHDLSRSVYPDYWRKRICKKGGLLHLGRSVLFSEKVWKCRTGCMPDIGKCVQNSSGRWWMCRSAERTHSKISDSKRNAGTGNYGIRGYSGDRHEGASAERRRFYAADGWFRQRVFVIEHFTGNAVWHDQTG